MDADVFEVAVYSPGLGSAEGWVGDPDFLSLTPRHNQQPTGEITISASHPKAGLLQAPGFRVVCHYRDEYTLGGHLRLRSSTGAGPSRSMTFQILDDWHLLRDVIALPVPGANAAGQSASEYDVRTGPAETVAKGYLTANVARLSAAFAAPVTIAPDLGRGSTITVQARFQPLSDYLFPLLDAAGIGLTVRQTLTGYVVDAYEPQTWPLTLSEDGGTVVGNDWSLEPPSVTRAWVLGPGEGTARVVRGPFVNAAAEAAWGYPIEDAVDARDIKADDPNLEALLTARGQQRLAEGAATAGLSLRLLESGTFSYGGTGVHVGDVVTAELAPGVTHTDVLRSATLTWGENGARVTPVIGDRTDDPNDAIVRAIARAQRAIRTQQTGA